MAKAPRRAVRLGIAAATFVIATLAWFVLAVYSGLEMMGAREHPVVDLFGWIALGLSVVALLVICFETVGAISERSTRWNRER